MIIIHSLVNLHYIALFVFWNSRLLLKISWCPSNRLLSSFFLKTPVRIFLNIISQQQRMERTACISNCMTWCYTVCRYYSLLYFSRSKLPSSVGCLHIISERNVLENHQPFNLPWGTSSDSTRHQAAVASNQVSRTSSLHSPFSLSALMLRALFWLVCFHDHFTLLWWWPSTR